MEAVGAGVRKLSFRRGEQSERTGRQCRQKVQQMLCQSVWLSRLISMSRDGRKGHNRAKGAAFLVLILFGAFYHSSVAPSTHSVISDLSEIGCLPLGSADEVVLSTINQEIKKKIQ